MYSIEQIAPYNTWAVRHAVLYPDKPFGFVRLAEDEEGVHFGLFDQNRLVTVISTFTTGDEMQFRKFATRVDAQGKGYGRLLLKHVISYVKDIGAEKLWCNARISASGFYRKFGFKETDQLSQSNGIDFVIMELQLYN